MNKQLTPLELLQLEKEKLKITAGEYEERLKDDFQYISSNAGKLVIDGLITAGKEKITNIFHPDHSPSNIYSGRQSGSMFSSILEMGKEFLTPGILMNIAKPFLLTFVLKKIKKRFL